jgi:glutamate synthase domain-containing protein 2
MVGAARYGVRQEIPTNAAGACARAVAGSNELGADEFGFATAALVVEGCALVTR